MRLNCNYLTSCRGCPLSVLDVQQQKEHKKRKFLNNLDQILPVNALVDTKYDFVFPVFDRYRTRCDFIYAEGRLGWVDQNKNFLPIDECPLHVPKLTALAKLINTLSWPVKRGSMRLRVSPSGAWGVWLDLANLDIKEILLNPSLLNALFDLGIIVEMGQKGKRAVRVGDCFKLSDPVPYPWFQTEIDGHIKDLNTLISSFTQTSPELNIQMIQILKTFLGAEKFSEIVEFGCGVGNFTLFLSNYTTSMTVIENDPRNLIPLKQNLLRYGLRDKVFICESVNSFFKTGKNLQSDSLYFVNPARSGVGPLFNQDISAHSVVYVSCHLESFLTDGLKLAAQGFKLVNATLFDQFPHAEHFEILSYFKK